MTKGVRRRRATWPRMTAGWPTSSTWWREDGSADYPYAAAVEHGVLIYDSARLRKEIAGPEGRREAEAELARALHRRPRHRGVHRRVRRPVVVDRATRSSRRSSPQRAAGGAARRPLRQARAERPGLERAGEAGPARAGVVRGLLRQRPHRGGVPTAWLGPGYQVTSQINVVNPGGAAQTAHRDYHLGFASAEQAARFPAHVHRLSPVLTLQGAVAHTDMPAETGPTLYLPHSQKYLPGYLAWRPAGVPASTSRPTTSSCRWPRVTRRSSTRPLPRGRRQPHRRGQAHGQPAAGVVGVRAAPWRPSTGPDVRGDAPGAAGDGPRRASRTGVIGNVIAACAEGYAFPTNLDLDQPVDGLAPAQPPPGGRPAGPWTEGWSATPDRSPELQHASSAGGLQSGQGRRATREPASGPGRSHQRRHAGPWRRHRPGGSAGGRDRRGHRPGAEPGEAWSPSSPRREQGAVRAGRRRRRNTGAGLGGGHDRPSSAGSTAWSTRPGSPPAAPCSTPRRSCSTSTSR